MRLKTFTAESLPEAMARVRERLGDDAVILSTQPDPESGGVRVTAAMEEDPTASGVFSGDDGLDAFNAVSGALEYHRVPVGLSDRLLNAAAQVEAENATMALAGALDAELMFGSPPQGPTKRPLLLMGPPGAGKTSTAAKLAAQVRVRGHDATLITLDVGKAGSLAQVSAFAEALGAQLREAHDAESLQAVVESTPGKQLVVIDAIGAGPFDQDAMREIRQWLAVADAEGVLVLPAGGDAVESAEVALAYQETGVQSLITTKLDTTRRLGGVLAPAHTARLTLMGVGVAATIGGGLRVVNPVQLSRLILPEEQADDAAPAVAQGAGA